jgi:hypothetical protein
VSKELLLSHSTDEFTFAKPIKDFCISALGLSHAQMYGNSEERESLTGYSWGTVAESIRVKYSKSPHQYMTAREVLQVVGSDVMREMFDPDVWAKAGLRQVEASKADLCYFSDVRMPNELSCSISYAKLLNAVQPLIIRVYRDTGLIDEHSSETALDHYDAYPKQVRLLTPPTGYVPVTRRLFQRVEGSNPFEYLLDNNSSVDELKSNLGIIYDLESKLRRI